MPKSGSDWCVLKRMHMRRCTPLQGSRLPPSPACTAPTLINQPRGPTRAPAATASSEGWLRNQAERLLSLMIVILLICCEQLTYCSQQMKPTGPSSYTVSISTERIKTIYTECPATRRVTLRWLADVRVLQPLARFFFLRGGGSVAAPAVDLTVAVATAVARAAAARYCAPLPSPASPLAARTPSSPPVVSSTATTSSLASPPLPSLSPSPHRGDASARLPRAPPLPSAAPASPAPAPSPVGSSAAATNASSSRPCRRLRIMSRRTCASPRPSPPPRPPPPAPP